MRYIILYNPTRLVSLRVLNVDKIQVEQELFPTNSSARDARVVRIFQLRYFELQLTRNREREQ